MTGDRRDFFSNVLTLGAMPSMLAMLTQTAAAASDTGSQLDLDTYKFWTQAVRKPSMTFAETGRLPVARGSEDTEMLYYSADTGFVRATDTQLAKLLLPKGDINVSVSMDTLRPSAAHIKMMSDSGSGSLRVDLKQAKPLRELPDTLSWSSIGTLNTASAAPSGFQSVTFDPKSSWGASKLVPLVDGIGFWAWNFNVQQGQSHFSAMLSKIGGALTGTKPLRGTGKANTANASAAGSSNTSAPGSGTSFTAASVAAQAFNIVGIGLPSIAASALHVVDMMYGFLQSQGGGKAQPVFQMPDQALIASQDARQAFAGRAMHLVPGQYVIVPNLIVKDLLEQKYKLLDYALVPSATSDADKDDAMASTLPDTAYATVSVGVSVSTG